ncbi:MAG TPA: M20 family metallopeptidase [Rectinema sp.]|nr:MAG: putative succinyl-diaminopimelate desuccinylase [Spirochaetes bacterium ADurb.Bin001]HNP93180.1 M20 family metallopeptidase [Rectinema sp.]HPY05757.1 M20 family metallopeptidase [Rectinema sp.]
MMLNARETTFIQSINKNELISLIQDLVQIDSVIRPETGNTEHNVACYIIDWIRRELDIEPIICEVAPNRENIILTIDSGHPGPCLMIEGHMDVVSEGDKAAWKYDPFGAEIIDGRIYGRGSCDMKAGDAIALLIAKSFRRTDQPWIGKLRLGIVCDEEGMMIGIKHLIKNGYADDVDACLIPEPEENNLCISMKGAIRAIVRVKGKMAHGAMPLAGINPNTRLARIILAFEEYEKQEKIRCGVDPYLGLPSITFTVIQSPPAGSPAQLNVMPAEAIAYVDIRTTPAQNHDAVKTKLQSILDELSGSDPDFKAELEFIEDRPVVSISKDEPIAAVSAQAYKDVTGKDPIWNGVPGATDGTFLSAWKNIPCIVNGPGPRHIPHQIDEYVEIDEAYECAKIYALTASRFLASKSSDNP